MGRLQDWSGCRRCAKVKRAALDAERVSYRTGAYPSREVVLIITGGRDYQPTPEEIMQVTDMAFHWKVTELVHGAATGADTAISEAMAKRFPGIKQKSFPYPSDLGKRGGPIRNFEMATYAMGQKQAYCIALTGGRGTADMVKKATDAGISVTDLRKGEI